MAALIGCIILLPLFIVVAVVLAVANRGNPFFLQVRPGKNERLFKIIKFKTMNDARDRSGKLLPDSQRLTPLGRVIRKSSLDEIPQLLNVLKGDMSIVGPRPLLPEYLKHFTKFQRKRHLVRPGITGLAAVNGRNAISWNKKFEYDVKYVRNLSFWMDLRILWKTFHKVVKTEGVNSANMSSAEPFNGKN